MEDSRIQKTAKALGTAAGMLIGLAINVTLMTLPLAIDRWWWKGSAWWLYGGYAVLLTVSRIAEAAKKKDESERKA